MELSGTYKYMIIHNATWQYENNSNYFDTQATRNEILVVYELQYLINVNDATIQQSHQSQLYSVNAYYTAAIGKFTILFC